MIFVVNEEPYSLVDFDIKEKNKEFIEGIDADYFIYILKVHSNSEECDKHRSYIALKAGLHHAMETMFALIAAYVQSHLCAYAWMAKYKNIELNKIIEKINRGEFIFTTLKLKEISWSCIANHIFQCNDSSSEKQKSIAKLFSNFWQNLANEYLDKNNNDEYNSVKHGFRARSGSFSLFAGIQESQGTQSEEMVCIGINEFGSSIFKIEALDNQKGNRACKSKTISISYHKEKVNLLLQLVYLSITNIKLAFKLVNNIKSEGENFIIPQDTSIFIKPWNFIEPINNLVYESIIDNPNDFFVTKNQLQTEINKYEKNKSRKQ